MSLSRSELDFQSEFLVRIGCINAKVAAYMQIEMLAHVAICEYAYTYTTHYRVLYCSHSSNHAPFHVVFSVRCPFSRGFLILGL